MGVRTGASAGPAHSHTRVTPRPGSPTSRVFAGTASWASCRTASLSCDAAVTASRRRQEQEDLVTIWFCRAGGEYARGLTRRAGEDVRLRRRAAGHDVTAAERRLPDLDVLDEVFQVSPRPVESAEAPHVRSMERSDHRVDGHHHRRGPLAPAGRHPCPGT